MMQIDGMKANSKQTTNNICCARCSLYMILIYGTYKATQVKAHTCMIDVHMRLQRSSDHTYTRLPCSSACCQRLCQHHILPFVSYGCSRCCPGVTGCTSDLHTLEIADCTPFPSNHAAFMARTVAAGAVGASIAGAWGRSDHYEQPSYVFTNRLANNAK